uniref:PKD domain-containing protein n=1 Tax=Paraferrimonas haliotis TaxID=2013866 RepID=UPI003CC82D71
AFPTDPNETVDSDNDGTGDNSDAFPTDPNETVDSDNDGTGDNADAFPTDPTETADSDSDGTGDNADAFPTDPTETADSDSDGTGDNADAFPTDPTETADSDNDGTGDNSDAFPTDPNESMDSDNDGIGNNEDTDDDNDGIPDVEDNNPLTPDEPIVVDTQAPVIGELIGVTFEATGKLTSIELPAPSVTDDMDENPSIVSTSTSDLSLGEHVVTWTASDVSGNQSTATQLVTIVDATAPEFDVVETLTINAAGRITNISSLLTVFANDLVDGELRATINGDTRLESGAHQVEMVATDASGNSSVNVTDVSILPSVATSSVNFVSPNLQLEVPVVLSGHAPNYPVSVRYEFTHNGQVIDGGSIDITASVNGSIALTVPDEVQPSDTLSLTLQEATNAFIGEHNSVMMVVVSDNKAPRLDIGMSQNGKAVSVIDIDAGMVDIVATVSDTNSIDTHTVNWVSLDGQLADMSNSTSYQIDPDALQPGLYLLQATAIENNTEQALSVTHSIQLFVEQLAELSSDNDADDDGVGDADEGFGDVDGDGIADYLDADDAVNTLPSALNAQPLHVSAANGLALGGYVTALYRNNATHASFPIDMLAALVSDGDADVSDINYVPLTPVYNFVISDGFEAGDSVSVVIPMVQDFTLPASAMYRKYSASEGWFNFVEDARNSLSSAAADVNGNCPTVNDGAYTPGLSEGDNCIQLTIEDGGPNDTDNAINASIEDPGLVVVQSDVLVPVIELIDYLEVSERNQVRIDASNSYDLADAALSFKWQQLTGDDIDLGDTQQSELLFTAPEVIDDTLLTFEVIVSNGELSSRAEVSVLVKQVNQAPVVSVETEQSEAMEGEIIQLFANAIDSDADALVYHWQQVSGTAATFEDSATEMLEVTLPQVTAEETLQFQVTVSDGEYSVTAIMEVTVYNQADPASPVEPKTVESGGSLGWILFVLYAVTSLRRSRKKYTA